MHRRSFITTSGLATAAFATASFAKPVFGEDKLPDLRSLLRELPQMPSHSGTLLRVRCRLVIWIH